MSVSLNPRLPDLKFTRLTSLRTSSQPCIRSTSNSLNLKSHIFATLHLSLPHLPNPTFTQPELHLPSHFLSFPLIQPRIFSTSRPSIPKYPTSSQPHASQHIFSMSRLNFAFSQPHSHSTSHSLDCASSQLTLHNSTPRLQPHIHFTSHLGKQQKLFRWGFFGVSQVRVTRS